MSAVQGIQSDAKERRKKLLDQILKRGMPNGSTKEVPRDTLVSHAVFTEFRARAMDEGLLDPNTVHLSWTQGLTTSEKLLCQFPC